MATGDLGNPHVGKLFIDCVLVLLNTQSLKNGIPIWLNVCKVLN